MPFKLIALVLPLSLDTFAVSAALGVAGPSRRERWRLSLLLAGFEAVMPIVGFLAGSLDVVGASVTESGVGPKGPRAATRSTSTCCAFAAG